MILPKENERDLQDVPEDVRAELAFVTVETVEEVLREALGIDLPRTSVMLHAGNQLRPRAERVNGTRRMRRAGSSILLHNTDTLLSIERKNPSFFYPDAWQAVSVLHEAKKKEQSNNHPIRYVTVTVAVTVTSPGWIGVVVAPGAISLRT